jgi:hypothetical protein
MQVEPTAAGVTACRAKPARADGAVLGPPARSSGTLRPLEQRERPRRDRRPHRLSVDRCAPGARHQRCSGGTQQVKLGGRPGVLTSSTVIPSRARLRTTKLRCANSCPTAGWGFGSRRQRRRGRSPRPTPRPGQQRRRFGPEARRRRGRGWRIRPARPATTVFRARRGVGAGGGPNRPR